MHYHGIMIMPMTMTAQSPHGLSCNGCDVANDDIAELERLQKIENITHDIFRNAARIQSAMRTNRLLVDVFRKYKHACREILQEKHAVLTHLVSLCDYCDAINDNPHQTKHDLKRIRHEISDISNEIKTLEELQWSDDDSTDSDSDSSAHDDHGDSDAVDDKQDNAEDDDEDDDASVDSLSSSSSASSNSSYDSIMDMEKFH